MMLSFLCLLSVASGVSSTKQTRTDDVGLQSLMTLVQQQAATIDQQAAVIQTLQSTTHTLQSRVDALESQSSRLQNLEKHQVAFSAHMSPAHQSVDVGNNAQFIFDTVVTNIGSNYNNHTGIFIAPSDGVYVFYFMMINDGNAQSIAAAIEKDGVVLGIGTSDSSGENNPYDDGSLLVTAHLRKGDQVYVKRNYGGNTVYGKYYCNFSGFLLVPDP